MATFGCFAVILLAGIWQIHQYAETPLFQYYIPGPLALISLWVCHRIVHMPTFADFLIHVEAEMSKVAWPMKDELIKSSIVVIVVIVFLAGLLFSYDLILGWLANFFGKWLRK